MLSDEGKTLIPFDFEYKFDIGHNIDEQIAKASNEAVGQEHIVNAVNFLWVRHDLRKQLLVLKVAIFLVLKLSVSKLDLFKTKFW